MPHARLSPSSSARWLTCMAAPVMESAAPADVSSKYAAEGTAAHHIAAICLDTELSAAAFKGNTIHVDSYGECTVAAKDDSEGKPANTLFSFVVNSEMVDHVQRYVDDIMHIVDSSQGTLMVEQRLPLSFMTGEEGAAGTSDTVILADRELIIADLKYGMRKVDAVDNTQLLMYAAAAYEEYSLVADFDTVRMFIMQPRLLHVSEHTVTVSELLEFVAQVQSAATTIATLTIDSDLAPYLNPSEAACMYCRAKDTCPALISKVYETVITDFDDLTAAPNEESLNYDPRTLANSYQNIGLIKLWIKNVEKMVADTLHAGTPMPGLKLVRGKSGNRKWADVDAAEATMRAMRIKVKDMYVQSLISPTAAETLAKQGGIGAQQWEKLQESIVRAPGAITVASENDPREAISVNVADEFSDLT